MCYYGSVLRLNISNILLVTTKPPQILTEDIKTDNDAKNCGKECGKYPPPKISNPPTAVIPEIALVIDISGVCKAGVTPQTEKYPVITDNENIVDIVSIAGLVVAYPIPNNPNIPPDNPIALFNDLLNKDVWTIYFGFSWVALFDVLFDASNIGGFGFGHSTYLFWVIIAPRTTSSFRSMLYEFYLFIIDCKNLDMLFEYNAEDCPDIRDGRSVYPIIFTPLWTTI